MLATERLENTKACPDPQNADCYTAAFYLTGIIGKEELLTIPEISRHLDECTEIPKPEIGSLVHLWNGKNGHITVVTELNPVKVTDRDGIGGEIRENIPLTDVMFEWGGLDVVVHYLRP